MRNPRRLVAQLLRSSLACVVFSAAGAAVAQDKLVGDYRKPGLVPEAAFSEAELMAWDKLRSRAPSSAAPANRRSPTGTLMGKVQGSFTTRERKESVYLVEHADPKAAAASSSRAPVSPTELRLGLEPNAKHWRLPTLWPNAIERAMDVDGDGVEEIVLRADAYQMGVSSISIAVVSLQGGAARVLLPTTEVYADTCDSPHGSKAIVAKTVRWRAGATPPWVIDEVVMPCGGK